LPKANNSREKISAVRFLSGTPYKQFIVSKGKEKSINLNRKGRAATERTGSSTETIKIRRAEKTVLGEA
jgi:hypothetical protein